jgi:DNA-binding GntR family transcriptional regulator
MFQRAAKNIDNAGVQVLKESAEKMSQCAAKGDRDGWMKHDKIFHETVIRAANNEMIAEVSRVTRRRIQRFWARSISGARDLVTCSEEHTEIAQGIIGKDMSAIREISRRTLNSPACKHARNRPIYGAVLRHPGVNKKLISGWPTAKNS